jgi:uncharacterized cupredoxin-like copper-binding protein
MHTDCKAIVVLMTAVGSLTFASASLSHGDSHAEPRKAMSAEKVETDFGRTGNSAKVSRTIEVGMEDTMRFTPGNIVVKRGETVRFKVSNHGKLLHEMVIGTMQHLTAHAELMKKFPGMEHDEPYMAHVSPGKDGDIVWQFTKAGEYHYACLIPGHMEAGMVARITVK